MQDLKIAVIQTRQFWEDKKANLAYFEKTFFSKIDPAQVDLILLPEMFSTSFSMNTQKLAENMDGETVQWMKKWAATLETQIGGSLIIQDQNSFYNRFLIVSKTKIETCYNKRHLFRMAGEHNHFTPGSQRVVYDLKGWKLLLQVCYDLRFPVFSRNRTIDEQKEYDALLYVANWPEKRSNVWKILLQARAIENQAYCLGLNRVGEDGNGISYSGDSMLVDPWGNIDAQFSEYTEEVKILTLKRQVLSEIAEGFPAFLDAD